MVIDLQDARNTLGDALQHSKIRLFGSSSQPVVIQPEPDDGEQYGWEASGSGSSDSESGEEGERSVEEEGERSVESLRS
jgi:ribosome biogenesis protein BMS1